MEHAPFVHLHTHSEYSILDGAAKIEDLVKKAVHYRMPALALTDHGNLFGALEFYEHAVCLGIKPIMGEEFYLAPTSMREKNAKEKPFHLVLLAKDEEGYRNLIQLSSRAYLDGFYYKPRIDKELLEKHAKGIIGMSSCLGGEIPVLIASGREEEARERVGDYLSIFGKEDFYLELMDNGLKEQAEVNRVLVRLSAELGVKLVATNDIHYLEKEDAEYHDVLLCIQTGKSINETKRLKFRSEEFYFKSPDEMRALFADVPEALRSTLEITEKCNLSLDLGTFHLPHFPIPEGQSAESYLKKLTEEGIRKRYGGKGDSAPAAAAPEVSERTHRELEVIKSMGFSTYFLIVWDFIQFAKKRGISVGPGRGSAAGSIVAYALEITDVDPLEYGLLFERFLNPSRISMPDIDIDFDGERRDEVIDYVRQKYGADRVAQIITFGAMKARAVVRDVARAMEMDLKDADAIAKMIPSRIDITIEEALKSSKELSEMVQSRKDVQTLFAISRGLEKLVRHPSTHAAGVVISPVPLTNIVPLYKDPKSGVISTQFQAKYLEHVGLIKMDFLGLKNLTVIEQCLESLAKAGLPVPDMASLDLKDRDVYALLSAGKSMGVFQLESSGMQNLLKRLGPNRFDDVIAVLALYRPGPLDSGMVDEFIERKNGRKPIVYPEPVLAPILKETYGVIVYQEQVMEIARAISGFSMAEADNLRKAIGKKKPELLEEQREKFIDGAVRENVSRKSAEEIFELIKTFGRYGFNKSHSTAYALLAFQTAYLKAHYPVQYLAALLSGELHDTDKIAQYIQETREMRIPLLPPDVNRSGVAFEVAAVDGLVGDGPKPAAESSADVTTEVRGTSPATAGREPTPPAGGGGISYALAAVKNVGEGAARSIGEERARGPYTSLIDFTSRVDLRLVNKRVIESLVKSGALDSFGETRATLFANIDGALEYGASRRGDRLKGQSSLFGESDEGFDESEFYSLQRLQEWDDAEKSEYEKEAMGFYFRSHPTAGFQDLAAQHGALMIGDLKSLPSESTVTVFGMIESLKKIVTKDGKEMAFLTIGDLTGSVEAVVFPSVYEKHSRSLQGKGVIVLSGRVNGEKVLADKIMSPDEFVKSSVSQIHVLLGSHFSEDKLIRLRDIFLQNTGKCHVFIHIPELETQKKVVKVSGFLLVKPSDELIDRVRREGLAEKVWVN